MKTAYGRTEERLSARHGEAERHDVRARGAPNDTDGENEAQRGTVTCPKSHSDVSYLQARYFLVLELVSSLQALVGPHSDLLYGVNGRV